MTGGPTDRYDHGAPPEGEPEGLLDGDLTRRAFLRRIVGGTTTAVLTGAGIGVLGGSALANGDEDHGSEMDHEGGMEGSPGTGASSTRPRRWAMVIDLRKCDGCVELDAPPQCTQACNWARFVPEGQQWMQVVQTDDEQPEGEPPHTMPMPCFQCENAPCANVCPVGATFHTVEGTVLIDQERCIGCRLCMAACPYDRRFFNWGDPEQPDWIKDQPYDVRTQIPAKRGTVMKCDFCVDRLEAGGLPSCAATCPRGAIYMGDLEEDIATNGSEVVKLSLFLHQNGAFRYQEELGTRPRVWYLPGRGELVPRTHHDELLTDRLEWPWREWNGHGAMGAGAEPVPEQGG
ncbi:MAG: 4Fe-4S dicluster domain-containing protein [Actinobacteria bacterium]|nr:4Fe-4S dicluster domain-containing protein [Actinomycetota bacterium]